MGNKVFRPKLWALGLTVVLCGAMIALGIWQLGRGQDKAELLARYEAAAERPPREMTAGAWAEPGVIERASVAGRFDGTRQLLLDNQSHERQPGYRVWTPLLLNHGGVVIVDRGWIPAGGDRSKPPPVPVPEGEVRFTGYWRTLPEPGMRLEVDNCAPAPWPRIVQYPTADELRCLYGQSVPGGLFLMDADAPGGYVREWGAGPELSPSKHYGYAAQWFAFAAVLAALFIIYSFRPRT
ncbi:SURF1 family protein [Sinimarinibacterium flocculans]|uniref:SURF1 family protein n=1 Tax=Sinimarinibacterium flocculans TaxID=985250 RepID=UPI0035110607